MMIVSSLSSYNSSSQSRNGGGVGIAKGKTHNCAGSTVSNSNHRRNRKTRIYMSSDTNSNYNNSQQIQEESPPQELEPSMMMTMTTPASQTAYKWTHHLTKAIQSTFELLATIILTTVSFLWNWTANTILVHISQSENNILKSIWNYILATMTIEIVTTTTTPNTMDSTTTVSTLTACLPVLRLNSVTMDEHEFQMGKDGEQLLEEEEDRIDIGIESGSDFVHSNSSNYNSSDGEQDTIVLSDDESNNNRALTTSLASTLEYLEKQQQQYAARRDSDSSCENGSNNNHEVGKTNEKAIMSDEDVQSRLVRQIETMFSDDHLAKDGFLLKHVRRRSDGFVSLKLVAGLRKVKQISREFNIVVESLRNATKVELNSDGTKVRRVEPLTPLLKSLPTTAGTKDKENSAQKPKNGTDQQHSDSELSKCMRANGQINNQYQKRSQRFSNASITSGSSVSPTSSACSSRHGSFSYQQPGGELFNRNSYNGPNEDFSAEQVLIRRRGASLPIVAHQQQKRHSHSNGSSNHLSPNSSPPGQNRPKSNSYCEGANITNGSNCGMSAWLQKRLASSRTSEGNITFAATVVRQPRGPDGSKGFASGYRQMILSERQVRERKIGQQMI